ncbi:hypothetical protein EQV77_04580 [Halobacillus fulvus]|nr:hypothetical protein EQV77_04580 [Halobacillus fulvus]
MNAIAFAGLWKKEWSLMKGYYIALALFNLLWMGLAPALIQSEPYIMTASILLILHLFYLSALLMYSFNREADQLELALHSPRTGYMIAGVKVLQSFTVFLGSLMLVSIAGILTARVDLILTWTELVGVFSRMGVYITGYSLSLAIILFFLWTVHQLLKKYIGGISLFVCIVLFFAIAASLTWIQGTDVYESLTSFVPFAYSYDLESPEGMIYMSFGVDALSVGDLVFFLMLNALFFLSGCWVLDRKVEV